LQHKVLSAPSNQVTDESVMMNVAEVTLDSSRAVESAVVDETISSGSSIANDDVEVVLVPSTTNELNMIHELAADNVGTKMEPSAAVQSIIESVNKEVDTTEIAPTLSNDNLEIKLIEETATTNILPQQEIASVLVPTEILTTTSPIPENVKEERLGELPSTMSAITSSDYSLGNEESVVELSF